MPEVNTLWEDEDAGVEVVEITVDNGISGWIRVVDVGLARVVKNVTYLTEFTRDMMVSTLIDYAKGVAEGIRMQRMWERKSATSTDN